MSVAYDEEEYSENRSAARRSLASCSRVKGPWSPAVRAVSARPPRCAGRGRRRWPSTINTRPKRPTMSVLPRAIWVSTPALPGRRFPRRRSSGHDGCRQKDFGAIDILVNNAGITRDKSFLKMTPPHVGRSPGRESQRRVQRHAAACCRRMVEAGWGRIINMTSIVGQTGNFGQANYAVSKGGLIAFTMTLAREVARKGVTVNAVAPGFIETDMTKDMTDAALAGGDRDDARGTAGQAGRSGRRRALPGLAASQLHHRPGHPRQRRNVHVNCVRIEVSFPRRFGPPRKPSSLSYSIFSKVIPIRRVLVMIKAATKNSTDMFQQAVESFESTLRAGMRLQEDSAERYVDVLRDIGSPMEWQGGPPLPRPSRPRKDIARSIQFSENVESPGDPLHERERRSRRSISWRRPCGCSAPIRRW